MINNENNEMVSYNIISSGSTAGSLSLRQLIGLGKATKIKEVIIEWPNKNRNIQKFRNLQPNTYYLIKEGRQPVELSMKKIGFYTP